MIEAWQSRRAELNHLQMRNLFLNSVTAAAGRLQSLPDEEATHSVIHERLSRWPRLSREYRALIHDFVDEMTPAVVIDRPPLFRLAEAWRESVRPVIHALWKARHPVDDWVATATAALTEADHSYSEMFPLEGPPRLSVSALERFQDRCLALCEAVSRFPSRIPLL